MKVRKRLYVYGAALIFVAGAASAVAFLPSEAKPKEVSFKQTSTQSPQEETQKVESVETPITPKKTAPSPTPVKTQTEEVEPKPEEPPVSARDYAFEKATKRKSNGFGFNWECFDQLIGESTGWTNLDTQGVDERFNYVVSQYSSTCAAYAKFKQTANY